MINSVTYSKQGCKLFNVIVHLVHNGGDPSLVNIIEEMKLLLHETIFNATGNNVKSRQQATMLNPGNRQQCCRFFNHNLKLIRSCKEYWMLKALTREA